MNRRNLSLSVMTAAFLAAIMSQAVARDALEHANVGSTAVAGTANDAGNFAFSSQKKKKGSKKSGAKCSAEHKAAGHC